MPVKQTLKVAGVLVVLVVVLVVVVVVVVVVGTGADKNRADTHPV